MIKPELVAELMLFPALEVLGGPCKDWRRKVRLFSYGLLPKEAEPEVIAHVRGCAACRLFLLQCFKTQGQVAAAISAKETAMTDPREEMSEVKLRLGSAEDASIERRQPSARRAAGEKSGEKAKEAGQAASKRRRKN
ncbi:MAG: hypothetical protein ACYC2I_07055 [Elusimicrobiales bacterium]